jgi:hypothetical protein
VIAAAAADLLPDRVPAWPELDASDGAIGFRTTDAVNLAVSMWPGADPIPVLEQLTAPTSADAPWSDADAERTYWRIADTKGVHAAIAWWRVRQATLPVPADAADSDELEHWKWVVSRRSASLEVGPGVLTVRWRTADAPKDPCPYGCRCCRHVDTCECPVCEQDRADAEYCANLIADGDRDGGEAFVVRDFSTRSRGRMMRYVASVSWGELRQPGERLMMLTLTYPGHWERWCPTPEAAIAHLDALAKRFQRATGTPLRCVWVREFQRRGAPHFHLLTLFPGFIDGRPSKDWLSQAWYEIVGSDDDRHLRAGTRIDYAKSLQGSLDPKRVAAYFAGYTAAGKDKGYQHQPPPGWRNDNGSVGAYWGRRGVTKATAEVAVTANEVIELKRLVRRMIRAQKRTAPRRVARQAAVNYVHTATGETITAEQWLTLNQTDQQRWQQVTGEPRRWRTVNRRWRLSSLNGQGPKADGERGFTVFANDAPLLAAQLARCVHPDETPWPKGQRRPLP